MTVRKLSSIAVLCAAGAFALSAAPARAADNVVEAAANQVVSGAEKVAGDVVKGAEDIANGVARTTGNIVNGVSPRRGLSKAQKQQIAAGRARNMALVRSRVPAVRRLEELRARQAANIQRAKQIKAAKK